MKQAFLTLLPCRASCPTWCSQPAGLNQLLVDESLASCSLWAWLQIRSNP